MNRQSESARPIPRSTSSTLARSPFAVVGAGSRNTNAASPTAIRLATIAFTTISCRLTNTRTK